MKKILLSLAVVAALSLASCGGKTADKATTTTEQEVAQESGTKYDVNLEESVITWKVAHKGGFAPRWGTIKLESGSLTANDNGLNAGDFVINMNTITADPASVGKDEGKQSTDLDAHLKNADFFDVEKYPTVTFQITKVEDFAGNADNSVLGDANALVSGNITILGNTVNTTFPAVVTILDGKTTIVAKFVANRADWGLKFGTTDESGAAINPAEWGISKDMEIGINLVANEVK